MNDARPPFGDRDVRRAIAFAMNREAVAEAAWFGAAQVNQTAIPEVSPFHDDTRRSSATPSWPGGCSSRPVWRRRWEWA